MWLLSLPQCLLLLFLLFNVFYGGALNLWNPLLMDVFGFTFAILIILYLSSLFTWKTVGLFAILLTIMDIILGHRNTGNGDDSNHLYKNRVASPSLPAKRTLRLLLNHGAMLSRGLGLGDFFFAGVLAVQTFNKFGKKTAIVAVVAEAVAFGIWEAFLPDILALS